MRKEIDKHGVKATLDPLDHFDADPKKIYLALGYVPSWVIGYGIEYHDHGEVPVGLQQWMEEQYGFGPLFPMTGGTIEGNLVHTYPEDPDLYPLVHFVIADGAEFIQYQHAICAMRQQPEDEWFLTRMD